MCGATHYDGLSGAPRYATLHFGIPGFNLWNILIINCVWAWLVWRKREGIIWDFPPSLRVAFLAYLFVIVWSFVRFLIDPTDYYEESRFSIINGYLVNPLKFLLPGLILFDRCRDRKQLIIALGAILLAYFIMATAVIRYMGLSNFSGSELNTRAARVIDRDVGYHRVDMSMMLAGASWGLVAFSVLLKSIPMRLAFWGAAGMYW